MTPQEAREILQQIRKQKCVTECDYGCKLYESETFCLEEKALDVAIKALEQQPCEDSISKEKMLKVIERMEKLEEDLYRTEGAESSFATLCLCVEWIKEALE